MLYYTIDNSDDNDDTNLDSFFTLLKYLNKQEPIDKKLVKDITDFITLRNQENKNWFLDEAIG